MKYARIDDGYVVEVIDFDPAGKFHPDIIWHEVPDDVVPGATTEDNTNFTLPEPEPESESESEYQPKFVTVMHFKLSFLPTERLALKSLRATNEMVDDFWEIMDDPRCTQIDLNLPSIKAVINSMVGQIDGFTEERAAAVLAGQIQ